MHWRAQVRWMLKKISKCFHKVKDDKCLAPSVCHRWDASVRQHVILIPTRIRLRMIFTLALPFFFLHVKYFMIKRHLRLFFSHYHHVGFHSRAPGFILFGPKARSLFECLGCEREREREWRSAENIGHSISSQYLWIPSQLTWVKGFP